MLVKNTRPSIANELAERLRNDILTGRKMPGDYLRLQNLSEEFGASLSPIREGLSVLASEGLVEQVGQRGYKVAPLLREHLVDATRARIALETICLRASIENGDGDWEAGVVASFWQLNKISATGWTETTIDEWEKYHHRFHESLAAGCGSQMLIEFCRVARRTADRFRRVRIHRSQPDQDTWEEHRNIFELATARRADEATEALARHIQRASDRLLSVAF